MDLSQFRVFGKFDCKQCKNFKKALVFCRFGKLDFVLNDFIDNKKQTNSLINERRKKT